MSKITLFMNTSLDIIIDGNDEQSAETNEQSSSESTFPEEHTYANELFDSADRILFGRTTYQGFTAYWDNVDIKDLTKPKVETDFASIFQSKQRVVFSRTLTEVPTNTILIKDDIVHTVGQLKKSQGQKLLLVCGSELSSDLISLNLVDEIQLILSPKLWGKGQSLFGKLKKPISLTLLNSKVFKTGAILLHYKVNQ